MLDRAALPGAVELARRHRGDTVIEEYIRGAEIHIGILDGDVLGTIEVRPARGFYDYEAKYQRDDTQYLIPATLPAEHVVAAEAVAAAAYAALGCAGHSRVDLRIRPDGAPFCLEVNTLPGMTSHSLLPKIAGAAGYSFGELCLAILDGARLHTRKPEPRSAVHAAAAPEVADETSVVVRRYGDARRSPCCSCRVPSFGCSTNPRLISTAKGGRCWSNGRGAILPREGSQLLLPTSRTNLRHAAH